VTKYASVWDQRDKQDFHDKKLRASSVPGLRFEGPSASEWDDDEVMGPQYPIDTT